jgi:hypothetical protein
MIKRDILERHAYAEHRLVLAIDRILVARTDLEREKASKWAYAWRDFSQCSNRVPFPLPPVLIRNKTGHQIWTYSARCG